MSAQASDFLYRVSACLYLTDRSPTLPPSLPGTISLLYNTDGRILLQYPNQSITMAVNSIAVLKNDTALPFLSGQDWMAIFLTISGGAVTAFATALQNKTVISTENSPIFSTLGDIIRIYRSHCPENDILLSDHIGRLLNALLTESLQKEKTDPTQDIVRQCVRYVESHFVAPLNLSALAEHVGVSKYHLSRIFSERTGMTLQSYHIACRIRESKRLLHDHTLPLSTICERVGFVDMSHFSKTFKKHEHLTPTQYRKRLLYKNA